VVREVSKTNKEGDSVMSKKNGTIAAVVTGATSSVVAPVVAPVKDGRGAKFGVPHITNKILAMSKENQEKWLTDKCATPEIRKDVSDRLTNILTNGKTTTKGKALDYASLFAGRDYDELTAAVAVLNAAIETSKIEAQKQIEELIAKFESEKIRLQEKFGTAKVC